MPQADGSIIIHIKKQYNNHSCEEYMKSRGGPGAPIEGDEE